MDDEFNALPKSHKWSLVLLPLNGRHIVGCRWVFKLQKQADGSIECHRARLVAEGFH